MPFQNGSPRGCGRPRRARPAAQGSAPGGLDARLPLPGGAPAGRRPENAHAAPAGLAGGAQARGTRGGAGGKLGSPGRTACIYPPPSLPFRGSNARVAWADWSGRPPDPRDATQVPLPGPSRAGRLLNPFLPPSLPPSQALSGLGPLPPPTIPEDCAGSKGNL